MKKELSACVIGKFNGYEFLRNHLQSNEKEKIIPIDIIYEPTLNDKKPIQCFFAPEISLGFYTSIEKTRKGKKTTEHCKPKQCHYCKNVFIKSAKKMEKHLSVCAGKAGFIYNFDNGKIIDYKDYYKHLRDLPFAVNYDFQTTTRNVVFYDPKMYIVSYSIIVAFYLELNANIARRIVTLRSYDQKLNALQSFTHFEQLEPCFFANPQNFNMKTLKQLQQASFAVQNKEKKIQH